MSTPLRQDWWQDLDGDPFTWHLPDEFNITRACVDAQNPADPALIVDVGGFWHQYTFGEVVALSRKFVTVLADLGITAGDRIGVMVPQGIEVLTAHLGAFRAGIVTVPLSVKFGSDAVAHRLNDSGARILVVDTEGYARIRDGLAEITSLEAVVLVGECPADPTPVPVLPYQQLLTAAAEDEGTTPTGPDSHAIIIYTSGTTGRPKGALHGHKILPAHMPGVRTAFDDAPQPRDVFWTPADWAWIGGLFDVLFPALAMGCPVVATPDKFTPTGAIDVMRRHKVTASFIPPTALKQMRSTGVDQAAARGVQLRSLATGGESLGDALQGWVADTFGVAINEFYGQTEVNMTVGTCRSRWHPEPGSMGRAFPGFTVALLDPDGEQVDTGQVGEICVAAGNPGQFLEYWNQPDKTREKVHDGWIHTGDLGRTDADGNLWYQGRADDVISSAGYRIGPGEIEECLLSHHAVAMAGVIGVPDQLRGEAVHAFVVLADEITATEELRQELQAHVKSRLAFYQYPRQITFLDQLPMTTTGKIMRRELRHITVESWTEH
ncbi:MULTISPECIES: AMP-binding protein [Rhodococcus]|uniref:AMP-binding protein n=1 Tax=Rhodococcus oxybenzonivorans TaxID=1990687 RepID=A0AAE4UXR6_9NOCA|nr:MULTISPECIES: AMP-binding protein [Rhodococcus]MDV7241704.1 AMP-binding protein [Rhodococcus oxybenzonivorans]MDV7264685.1 AMP-binding protein [Rhodococcus oxybenzonivorans]MDV7273762.1 AMP-binding protein [Rhodococcus oxybenzonivorans]MDV7333986.1 AMP-binding protein [Rhodococcus oxybenzonivorans]MDV7343405.1 AMP-binding protein [Rhodococcus oxybenzonivorans]